MHEEGAPKKVRVHRPKGVKITSRDEGSGQAKVFPPKEAWELPTRLLDMEQYHAAMEKAPKVS